MEPTSVKRKLAVILAANLEGYGRLTGADEEATPKTLGAYRQIIDGPIARHDGRIFGTGGDSVLAEFSSAVEAVRCAIFHSRRTQGPECGTAGGPADAVPHWHRFGRCHCLGE